MFTAIVYVLRIAIEIPFPLASYLKLEIWEIPIYIALISFRFRTSLSVAALTFLLVQVFSTGLPAGPAYNLIAILSVMLGILIIKKSILILFILLINYKIFNFMSLYILWIWDLYIE